MGGRGSSKGNAGGAVSVSASQPAVKEAPKEQTKLPEVKAEPVSEPEPKEQFSGTERHIIGEGSYVEGNKVVVAIRGGGLGNNAQVYKMEEKADGGVSYKKIPGKWNTSKSGRSGSGSFELAGDGVYRYREVTESSSRTQSGFVEVRGGKVRKLSKEEGERYIKSKKYVENNYDDKDYAKAQGFRFDSGSRRWVNQ